jgi:hypothetical protein
MFLKVIACEILFREVCHLAARTPGLLDLEFVPQGLHDVPAKGRLGIQQRIDATPPNKYDAILLGYGLCSNILAGLAARHTPLVIPRAHDCIALFLGSKERHAKLFHQHPGTYYYTSGWLECRQRRGDGAPENSGALLPASATIGGPGTYEKWVHKYGEAKARYLVEVMNRWTQTYTHGLLIDLEFARPLGLRERVQRICAEHGWQYKEVPGDLGLLERGLAGRWDPKEFLCVPPGRKVEATYDEDVVGLAPAKQDQPKPTKSRN